MRLMEIDYDYQQRDEDIEMDELLDRIRSKLMGNYSFTNTTQVNNILEIMDHFIK